MHATQEHCSPLVAALAAVRPDGVQQRKRDQADRPRTIRPRQLDWTIAFGPGGGNDLMARKLVQIIQDEKLYPADIAVENREGGSGATGWGYLMSKAGDPYNISTTSGSFLTTPLQADPGWTYKDFTHVGLMATDDALLLVDGKKPIKTYEDWVAFAKGKGGKVVVGGIGTVNVDFILQSLIAEAGGLRDRVRALQRRGPGPDLAARPVPSTRWCPTPARSSARSRPAR